MSFQDVHKFPFDLARLTTSDSPDLDRRIIRTRGKVLAVDRLPSQCPDCRVMAGKGGRAEPVVGRIVKIEFDRIVV